jgi:hypothetical protein
MTVPAKLIPRQWNIYRNVPRDKLAETIRVFIAALDMDKPWRVTVDSAKSTRSDLQNRYLNGVCYKLIGDAIGYERDEVSEFLCGTYWGWKEKRVPKKPSCPYGIESVPIRTTTTGPEGGRSVLSKIEFGEYVAFVQRFGASKGIHIPDPDPDYAEHRDDEAEAAA